MEADALIIIILYLIQRLRTTLNKMVASKYLPAANKLPAMMLTTSLWAPMVVASGKELYLSLK